MTDRAQLRTLLIVSTAHYDRQRQALAKLMQQENALRQELVRLSGLGQQPDAPEEELAKMRAIGADLLWNGWLGRAKTTINMQLARVLATKENEQAKVRRAFGKVTALQQILDQEERKHRKKMETANLAKAVEFSVHRGLDQ